LLDIVRAPVAVIAPAIARPFTMALSARVIEGKEKKKEEKRGY